jgi:hypothetical protein
MSDTPQLIEQDFHYFATTAYAWAPGLTRKQAIEACARLSGKSVIDLSTQKGAEGGLYFWSCRVNAPLSTLFTINNYRPEFVIDPITKHPTKKRVDTCAILVGRMVNTRGHIVPLD